MSIKLARVVTCSDAETQISIERECNSCQSCVFAKTQILVLPGSYNDSVELQLDFTDQWFSLFHSLMLPLLVALVFAFVADWLLSDELYGIISAFCGFTLGKYLCRQLHPSALMAVESPQPVKSPQRVESPQRIESPQRVESPQLLKNP